LSTLSSAVSRKLIKAERRSSSKRPTELTIKWTERTTVDGLKGAIRPVDLAGREGEHVVIHYSVEGADKIAVAVKRLGRPTPKEDCSRWFVRKKDRR